MHEMLEFLFKTCQAVATESDFLSDDASNSHYYDRKI